MFINLGRNGAKEMIGISIVIPAYNEEKGFGYSVKEIPIHWINCSQSKVHLLSNSLRMLITLIKILIKH